MNYNWKLHLGGVKENGNFDGDLEHGLKLFDCQYHFFQPADALGQPSNEYAQMRGIPLTIDGFPPAKMIRWIFEQELHDGALILYDLDDISPLKKMIFRESACTGLRIYYSANGTLGIKTQITLQPHKVIMGQITLDRNWLKKDDNSYENPQSLVDPKADFLKSFDVFLMLENGKEYLLKEFSIHFLRNVNELGQPCGSVHGGEFQCSIVQISDETLDRWMLDSSKEWNGEIQFRSVEQVVFRIAFTNGNCIDQQCYRDENGAIKTEFTISAHKFMLNDNQSLVKNWSYQPL